MKKPIIAVFAAVACVALCAAVWPRSSEVADLPADPEKPVVNAEIAARSKETPHIFISEDTTALETEVVAESNSPKTEITAEKETEKVAPTQTTQQVEPATPSTSPHNGDVRVVNGEKQIYLLLPAIVSKKEWLTAQTELVSRNGKRVPRGNNIAAHRYAGLLKCGDCGTPFIPIIRKTDKEQRIEYICKNYQLRGRSFCESHRIHEEKLDAEVRSAIETLLLRLRIEMADIQKELKIRVSSKPILDARASLLRAEIQSLDRDIDAALMERINDKPNTNR